VSATVAWVAPDALTPYAVAARDLLRSTLLDAVRGQLQVKSWAAVTMADVARAAGVSRQTLYKEFGSRAELAQAYVLRETDRFASAVEGAVTANVDDPSAALAAAFDVFLAAAEDDPLVRAVVSGDGGDELLALVTVQGLPVLERGTERLAAFLRRGWPTLAADDALLLSETVVRLGISYATLPSGPAGLDGASVAKLLGPYVREVLSRPAAAARTRSA